MINGYVIKVTDDAGVSYILAKDRSRYELEDVNNIPCSKQYDQRSTAAGAVTRLKCDPNNIELKFEVYHGEEDW